MFDAELYRKKAEVEEAKKRDPILLFTQHLKEQKLLEDTDLQGLEDDVAAVVQHAVDFAEAATWEPVEELTRFLYSERSERRQS
jgi:pyruvate dehydrogenase E1 component alpha subunit/2-oxoisovalerate dehydrogenase E1 component